MSTPYSHNTAPGQSDRKLYSYTRARGQGVMLVEKTLGARFSVAELTRHASQPIADDMGVCIYVQTVRQERGNPVREQYYVNTRGAVDRSTRRGMLLPSGYAEDPHFDITVGEQWQSPFGLTPGVVEAIGSPYVDAYVGDDSLIQRPDPVSPLERGEMTLRAIPSTAHTPMRLPDVVFDVR